MTFTVQATADVSGGWGSELAHRGRDDTPRQPSRKDQVRRIAMLRIGRVSKVVTRESRKQARGLRTGSAVARDPRAPRQVAARTGVNRGKSDKRSGALEVDEPISTAEIFVVVPADSRADP